MKIICPSTGECYGQHAEVDRLASRAWRGYRWLLGKHLKCKWRKYLIRKKVGPNAHEGIDLLARVRGSSLEGTSFFHVFYIGWQNKVWPSFRCIFDPQKIWIKGMSSTSISRLRAWNYTVKYWHNVTGITNHFAIWVNVVGYAETAWSLVEQRSGTLESRWAEISTCMGWKDFHHAS